MTALVSGFSDRMGQRRRCDAAEGGVDDVADELVAERGMAVQQPVVERAVEQVDCDLGLGAGGDLAAIGGTAEDRAGLVAARLDKASAIFGRGTGGPPGVGGGGGA